MSKLIASSATHASASNRASKSKPKSLNPWYVNQLRSKPLTSGSEKLPPKLGMYPFDSFFSPIRSNCSSDTAESCLNSSVASLCFERSSSVRTLGGS